MGKRTEYPLHIREALTNMEFALFLKDLKAYEVGHLLSFRQDEFLDAYSIWLKRKEGATKTKVLKAACELSYLDPSFQFHLSKR